MRPDGPSRVVVTGATGCVRGRQVAAAIRAPRELPGQACGTLLYPRHAFIFRRMVGRIAAWAAAPTPEAVA